MLILGVVYKVIFNGSQYDHRWVLWGGQSILVLVKGVYLNTIFRHSNEAFEGLWALRN